MWCRVSDDTNTACLSCVFIVVAENEGDKFEGDKFLLYASIVGSLD